MSIDYVSRRVMDTYMDRAIIKHQRLQNRIRALTLVVENLTDRMETMESSYCQENIQAILRALARAGIPAFETVTAELPTEGLGSD